jgi:hypothetical protein
MMTPSRTLCAQRATIKEPLACSGGFVQTRFVAGRLRLHFACRQNAGIPSTDAVLGPAE